MALYNIIQRSVFLRANLFVADTAAAIESAYILANPGATELDDRSVEFPYSACNDAILQSAERMVGLIGLDVESPYRSYFAGVTSSLATGATIPTTSSASKPVVGVIGEVRDASTSKRCTAVPYEAIIRLTNILSYFNTQPHHFYTDDTRIWHTRTNVVADVVIWLESDQRALLESNPRGACPFPEVLFPALIEGALSFLFRGEFNLEQQNHHHNRWNELLQDAGIRTQIEQRIATA